MPTAIWCLVLLLGAMPQDVPPPDAADRRAEALREQYEKALQTEAAALGDLAARLARDGHADEATQVRSDIEPPAPPEGAPMPFTPLPEIVPATPDTKNAPEFPEWQAEKARLRQQTAKTLFQIAGDAANAERYTLASQCLRDLVDREPDHAEARRLLGYVPYEGGWAKPHAAAYLKKGFVLDPTFGWVPGDWVPHLQRGELPGRVQGSRVLEWLPAREADALRAGWNPPWEITTEHFAIRTNVPLDRAIAFGRKLEALHDVFHFLFADVLGREIPLARRFRDPDRVASTETKTHRVMYFNTKEEYVDYLTPTQGESIAGSLGFYRPPGVARGQRVPGQSFFFRDDEGQIDVTSTLFHETSHQLLFETAGPTRYEANVGNFWVWEGLGTYFETFHPRSDGSCLIGGLVGPRVAKAQRDEFESGTSIPIKQLVRLNKTQFNDDQDVYTHYAESMALVIFLMHHDGGRYRSPFLEYVRDAYAGRLRPGSSGLPLDRRLGVSYETLDEQFRDYLKLGEIASE